MNGQALHWATPLRARCSQKAVLPSADTCRSDPSLQEHSPLLGHYPTLEKVHQN